MHGDEFIALVLQNPINCSILERLPACGLADAWLVSGCLFQTVWNLKTGRPPEHGIKDYDIFYFDPDVSWKAEDAAIKRAAKALSDLNVPIEVRNQARVHLWYEEKFHAPYPPLTRATDGIDRFLMPCAQLGLRKACCEYELYTPNGLDDLAAMIVRPNRTQNFWAARYLEKAKNWKALWPALTVMPAD